VFIFVLVDRLLEHPRKFGFRPILGVTVDSVEIFRHFKLHFGATDPELTLFLWLLRIGFFEAHLLTYLKIWRLLTPKSYKIFMEPPYTIVTPSHIEPGM